jgi:hypothetical protein
MSSSRESVGDTVPFRPPGEMDGNHFTGVVPFLGCTWTQCLPGPISVSVTGSHPSVFT